MRRLWSTARERVRPDRPDLQSAWSGEDSSNALKVESIREVKTNLDKIVGALPEGVEDHLGFEAHAALNLVPLSHG
jgi:hypothetical protein